jgi:hypothetical protein
MSARSIPTTGVVYTVSDLDIGFFFEGTFPVEVDQSCGHMCEKHSEQHSSGCYL